MVRFVERLRPRKGAVAMLDSDLAAFIERDRQALDAIVKGDPEPKKRLYSRRDDVTLATR
jgi:hypothetical protein